MRVKAYLISEELFLQFLSNGKRHAFTVESDIPEDAVIHAVVLDAMIACVRIVLRHDSFDEVPSGNAIPVGNPPVIRQEYHVGK